MNVIRAIVDARTSQNLTQKELDSNQADISKIENGTRNPSLAMVKRIAKGVGMQVKIEYSYLNIAIIKK
ncbi:helix-turn-helix transcriptional regulator [Kandleria sp.]|uniref:helix-turn-helix domain-containing protein n=1 Tax=Kandleria sp. TaxID=2774291 RepID=UPI001B56B39F|nr:helix-turn-helix transcriptional regulator [Kandleria sp.]MBP3276126.1 helix-turn-helix transcriptional regulator [Kandleria sp.]